MDFISFGNYGQLAVESAEEAVGRNLLARQHITADVAQVFIGGYVALEDVGQQCSHLQLAVSGFQHFTACYGYGAGEVYATGVHQTADKEYGFRSDSPYRLTFHYGRDVVDLHTYVTRRIGSVECGNGNVLCLHERGGFLFYTDVQIRLCHSGQSVKSCLEVCFFAFQNEFEVGSQRIAVESRNEDSFRSYRRVGDYIVRTLADESEHTGLQ